ncbi:MAG: M42 family peptidase, partial [Clostridia bacterium]|nr:M42 family peptidase [Clostridia bacterium]
VSYNDAATIGDKKLVADIIAAGEANGVTYQIKRGAFGGNDAGIIHTTAEGTPSAVISVPVRYIHSPVSVASWDDYNNTVKLIDAYLKK